MLENDIDGAEKQKPPRKHPSKSKIEASAKHVAHDIRRLGESYNQRGDAFAYTAWYTFCRSVMDFMESTSDKNDDVLASDYFEDPDEWQEVLKATKKPEDYKQFRTAVNKLAAHLTYSRAKYEDDDKFAPSGEITDYLLGLAHVFYTRLPKGRKLWFVRLFR